MSDILPDLRESIVDRIKLEWKQGRPAELWITHRHLIDSLLRELKPPPMKLEHAPRGTNVPVTAGAATDKALAIDPRPYPGGMKCAHLHYLDDIYLLTDAQWHEFCSRVLKVCRQKLAEVETVGFPQMLDFVQSVNAIGGAPPMQS